VSANDRRRAIIEALCERKTETRENLAFEFNVSKRTITRDIVILSTEYPIYTSNGNGGGIYIAEGYKLDGRYMSEKQTEFLIRLSKKLKDDDLEVMKSIIKTFGVRKRK